MENDMKIFKAFVAALAVSMVVPSALGASTLEIADANDSVMAIGDYYPTGNGDLSGVIGADGTEKGTMYFSSNTSYAVTGVCDMDCSDIDVYIYDKYGDLVAEDADASDTAIATFRANYTGAYTVKTRMYKCSTSVCVYRVRSYVRR